MKLALTPCASREKPGSSAAPKDGPDRGGARLRCQRICGSGWVVHEYFRFESWAEQSGYIPIEDGTNFSEVESEDRHATAALEQRVNTLVAELSEVLTKLHALLEKYKINPRSEQSGSAGNSYLNTKPITVLPDSVKRNTGVLNAIGSLKTRRMQLGKETGRLRKINFSWSLTNETNDRDRIKEYLNLLTYWNDALRETLPVRSRQFHSMLSQIRTVNNADTQQALKALQTGFEAIAVPSSGDMVTAALMKSERLAVRDNANEWEPTALEPIPKSSLSLSSPIRPDGAKVVTTLTQSSLSGSSLSTRVIVDLFDAGESLNGSDKELVEFRIKQLKHLLRRQQRPIQSLLPVCKGYVREDSTRYLLLYELPPLADPIERPKSLYEILPVNKNSVQRDGHMQLLPLLDQRLSLAKALTNGVLQLHNIGWLHKCLHSDNILLFYANDGIKFSQPLLAGFGVGRSADPGERTIDLRTKFSPFELYSHPELRLEKHRRFQRRYDIYSLGLVLFEIGVWQNLHFFYTENKTPEDFKRRIVNFARSHLGHLMGEVYMQVVLLCIDQDQMWNDAEGDGSDPLNLLEIFSWKVAKRLNQLSAT